MSVPTHVLGRKVLSLTKPKDKIYKTKNDNIKKILLQLYNINTELDLVCMEAVALAQSKLLPKKTIDQKNRISPQTG